MRKKKLKSKLSKKYVTDGELLKDVRDQLIVELPKLTRRRAMATVTFYTFTLGFVALFFVDCSKTTRTEADLVAPLDAEVAIVKLPEPDWQYYGLSPGPDHWRIPNPSGRSCCVFDIALTAQTLTYQRTFVRALAQDLAGEARLDLMEAPLIVKCPTILLITPTAIDEEDRPVREAIIRTCAIRIGDKQIPLRTFVDPVVHNGRLVVEIRPETGQARFEENLAAAFGRLIRFIKTTASRGSKLREGIAELQPK